MTVRDTASDQMSIEDLRPLLLRYFSSRVRRADDAEDLVQITLLAAHKNIDGFRGTSSVSTWVLAIGANRLRNYYERDLGVEDKNLAFCEDFLDRVQQNIAVPCPSDEVIDAAFIQSVLRTAREVCTPQEYRVLVLRFQGEPAEEIARLERINASTVRSHVLRGRGKLLAALFCNEPEMFGGRPAIDRLLENLVTSTAVDLGSREILAWRNGLCKSEAFRTFCLKMAPHVSRPMAVLIVLEVWRLGR